MRFFKHKRNKHISDQQLIDNYRDSDDTNALSELLYRYSHLVFMQCIKFLKNPKDSEDATMEIFSQLINTLKKHQIANFKNWIFTVTRNHCLMKLRRKKHKNTITKNNIELEQVIMENDYNTHLIDEGKISNINIEKAINQLNEAQKTCIRLFYYERKSYKEIAKMNCFDINIVKSNLQNGKKNLKKILETGSELIIKDADVANRGQMDNLVNHIEENYGQINGIIHAAGVLNNNSNRFFFRRSCVIFPCSKSSQI